MAELDFISKFSGEEIDNILDKSQELLNKGYTFSGVATPETDPGTPSLKVFYLTTTAGKYANFDNITVESGKLTVLLYNGSMWQNQVLDLPTSSEPDESFVRYDEAQDLTDTQKQQARTNIGAARGQDIQNITGSAPTLSIVGGVTYVCGELTTLTVNSIEDSTDESWVYFTSGSTPTVVTWPTGANIAGDTTIVPNVSYEVCIRKSRIIIVHYEQS